jgi:hypothetical protein
VTRERRRTVRHRRDGNSPVPSMFLDSSFILEPDQMIKRWDLMFVFELHQMILMIRMWR